MGCMLLNGVGVGGDMGGRVMSLKPGALGMRGCGTAGITGVSPRVGIRLTG
jgi:hypothetical protein